MIETKRTSRISRPVATLLIVSALVLGTTVAHAALIERVVAVVNDEAILLSDVRRRAVPFIEQAMEARTDIERMSKVTKLYKDVLERLIDEALIQQAARDMQVTVTRQDEDRAIQNVQAQSGLSDHDFWEAVRAQGFTTNEYRNDVRRQLLRLKVLNQRVRGRVNITEAEVRQRYEDLIRQARRAERFRAAHIFFPVPETASPTEAASIRSRAANVAKEVDPKNFDETMAKVGGGDLGWLKQGDLPPVLEKSLLSLAPGSVSAPTVGPSGIHIFYLRERQQGLQEIPAYPQVKERIYRSLVEQAMARQEKVFLADLKRQAVIVRRLSSTEP